MSCRVLKLCPVCVYPRPLKHLGEHLSYAHKITGRERKRWVKRAKVVPNSTLLQHRSIRTKRHLDTCRENDSEKENATAERREEKVEKVKSSCGHKKWLERLELKKKKITIERVCQDAVVETVFNLFATEYEYKMRDEKHIPQESYEVEMMLAFDFYWIAWSQCNNSDDDGAVIDYDYVAQVSKEYVMQFKHSDFPELDEDTINEVVDEQLLSLWETSNPKNYGLLSNLLKRKVTAKLVRDEMNNLKRTYIDSVCGVYKTC